MRSLAIHYSAAPVIAERQTPETRCMGSWASQKAKAVSRSTASSMPIVQKSTMHYLFWKSTLKRQKRACSCKVLVPGKTSCTMQAIQLSRAICDESAKRYLPTITGHHGSRTGVYLSAHCSLTNILPSIMMDRALRERTSLMLEFMSVVI
jgi:hypothetical protein